MWEQFVWKLYLLCMMCFRGTARYEYTHEVLPNEKSFFKGQKVERTRRISVICRSDPFKEDNE